MSEGSVAERMAARQRLNSTLATRARGSLLLPSASARHLQSHPSMPLDSPQSYPSMPVDESPDGSRQIWVMRKATFSKSFSLNQTLSTEKEKGLVAKLKRKIERMKAEKILR